MTPGAKEAQLDFTRLASIAGGPLYIEDLLRTDSSATRSTFGHEFDGLADWPGIAGLKRSLRRLVGGSTDLPVLLASRSSMLTKLAATLLFRCCENVLVTDLGWPGYNRILEAVCDQRRKQLTVLPVRSILSDQRGSVEHVANLIASSFVQNHCDGLFLTAVSHDGFRLPIAQLVAAIEQHREIRFVVVDGAQALCHTPDQIDGDFCDLFLAGCHKWLGAFQPLAVAFYGRRRSRNVIENVLAKMIAGEELDDPLLSFIRRIENDQVDVQTETVNTAPLFSCFGAVKDAINDGKMSDSAFRQRIENSHAVSDVAVNSSWRPVSLAESLRSGILLIESPSDSLRAAPPRTLRAAFQDRGVALTAYSNGRVRMSMPSQPLSNRDLDALRRSLKQIT